MKYKTLKILFSILVIISCSKDSDEVSYQLSSETNQSTNTSSNTSSNSSSTAGSTSTSSSTTAGSTSTGSSSQNDNFDRSSILINYSENIIIPRYNTFKISMDNLKNSIDTFTSSPTIENYNLVQLNWTEAYKKWQYVEVFNIGKAEEIMFNLTMNTFPVSKERIDSNIENEKTDLTNPNDWAAQGFPAIDYMLHGIADNKESVIEIYNSNTKYSGYLNTLVSSMSANTDIVVEDWETYKDSFNSSYENNATSAFNMMVNDFVYYFEKGLRTNKIGIPAGRFSGSQKLPEKIEAYYYSKNSFGNLSKTLVLEAILAVENIFLGKNSEGTEGPGYKSYLDYLNSDIGSIVVSRFEESKEDLNKLDENFITQIETDNTSMLYFFDILQKIVVNFKTDMLSNFNIAVDYTDADGD